MVKSKKLFVMACILIGSIRLCQAQGIISVWSADGSRLADIALALTPKATVTDEAYVFTADDGYELICSYADGDVRVTFGQEPVTPTNIQPTEEAVPLFTMADGTVNVENLRVGEPVRAYDSAGRLVAAVSADGNGRASLSLHDMPQGVYIIKNSSTSIKLSKK